MQRPLSAGLEDFERNVGFRLVAVVTVARKRGTYEDVNEAETLVAERQTSEPGFRTIWGSAAGAKALIDHRHELLRRAEVVVARLRGGTE